MVATPCLCMLIIGMQLFYAMLLGNYGVNWSDFIQQQRGSLVFLYVFGPYVIDKALRKLELWLQNEENWPSGEKCLKS